MAHLLWLLVSGYVSVFLLGFQSRAVNYGNYWMAAANSILIGLTQWGVWTLAREDHSTKAALVFAIGGAAGIVSSMFVHQRLLQRWRQPKQ